VAIVNQVFARRYLGSADPLTVQLAYGFPTVKLQTRRQIVGVVRDVTRVVERRAGAGVLSGDEPESDVSPVDQAATSLADPMKIAGTLRPKSPGWIRSCRLN
jgi:hypothetical protein